MKINRFLSFALTALFISSVPGIYRSPVPAAAEEQKITVGYYCDNASFQNYDEESGKKSGYAYEYLQELLKYTNWKYEYVYGTFDEIKDMLSSGTVDMAAGISEAYFEENISGKNVKLTGYSIGKENEELFDIPGAENDEFYIAVTSEKLYQSLSEAQKLVMSRNPSFCDTLTEKYFGSKAVSYELTYSEKNWLSSHKTIMIGYLDGYMPYSDKNEDTKSTDGAISTIFSELNSATGKSISAVKYSSYEQLCEALENENIDAMFPAYYEPWKFENQGIVSTRTIFSDKILMLSAEEKSDFSKLAVLSSSPVQAAYTSEYFPDYETLVCDSTAACIKALRKGRATHFFVEENVLSYYLSDGKSISDINVSETDTVIQYCFAVKRSNSALCGILDTALSSISESTVNKSVNQNLYKKNDFTFFTFFTHNIWKVMIFIVSATILAFLFRLRNKRALKKKQSEVDSAREQASAQEKETNEYRKKTENDHLTGVFSRGHFLEEANKKLLNHRPNDTLQLVMMDIDNFKSVNDTYGHDNGDVVLVRLGSILREISRVNGFAGRFGGEEFFIFMYGEDPSIQEHIINQVCAKLRETTFPFTDRHITISVGVTVIGSEDTIDKCIERADKALYYSKNHGKNQVNHFEEISDKL